MALADTNRVGIRIVEEATWGTTPSGPALLDIPYTGESLQSNTNTVTSDTIRSDRNVSDITKVGGGAGGDINFEMRYADYDLLFGGLMQSSAVVTNVSAGVASAAFASSVIIADSNAFSNVVSGQHLKVTGATTSGNNGVYRINSFASSAGGHHTITLEVASTGVAASFTSEVFAAGTQIQGKRLRNGTTNRSFTVEKNMQSDVSTAFQFAGMRVNTANLNFETEAILTGSFGFLGKSMTIGSTTVASAVTAASGNDVMNASGNVGNVWVNSDAVTDVYFQNLTMNVTNNMREQKAVGQDANVGIGSGKFQVTGTMNAYFEDSTLISQFENDTKSSIRMQVTDNDGNSVIFTIPKITWTAGNVLADSGDSDAFADLSWGASIDETGTYAMQIDLLDA